MESIVNFLEEKSLYDISEHDLLDVWDTDLTQVRFEIFDKICTLEACLCIFRALRNVKVHRHQISTGFSDPFFARFRRK